MNFFFLLLRKQNKKSNSNHPKISLARNDDDGNHGCAYEFSLCWFTKWKSICWQLAKAWENLHCNCWMPFSVCICSGETRNSCKWHDVENEKKKRKVNRRVKKNTKEVRMWTEDEFCSGLSERRKLNKKNKIRNKMKQN